MDAATGKVLYEDQADTKGYPASVLKLMDLLIVLEKIEQKQLSLADQVPVSAKASHTGGSRVWLKEKEVLLENIVKEAMKGFPRSSYRLEIKPQYRNMKQVIDAHPEIVDHAMEAIRRAGLTPVKTSIRGGTDGSRLSFMGLPCPNIFAGEHAFHSRLEWVGVRDMEKAVQTIVHLAMIWEERA